ncbi:MAG: methylated-DNA--[protein]-cysteine S-methyltransferase [Candidatus Levybacteria bacterium]|nr:methylated-DNA--[protein]-cysteine S-methyltransferase [Candidatus Levybacteria bacterium]
MNYDSFNSPIGLITIATDGQHLTHLHIEGDRYFTAIPVDWENDTKHPILKKARKELLEYFDGKRNAFDIPVQFSGTPFQTLVWHELQKIPSGQSITYKQLAEKIGKPKAVRAVGTAVGRNPMCIIIPCHRVRASDGSYGGYVAGLECKQKLLSIEAH